MKEMGAGGSAAHIFHALNIAWALGISTGVQYRRPVRQETMGGGWGRMEYDGRCWGGWVRMKQDGVSVRDDSGGRRRKGKVWRDGMGGIEGEWMGEG